MSPGHKHAPKVKCTRAAFYLGLVVLLACALAHAVGVSAQGGSPGTLSFSQAEYDVSEGVGNANITLSRTGGTDGAVTAKVSLTDVTTSPADYLSEGKTDPSFDTGSGADALIYGMAVQPDNKVLLAGGFLHINGIPRSCLARLNADGSLDTSFGAGSGLDMPATALALQQDGKIIVGGVFTTVGGVSRNHIARLNPDGSLDATFDPGTGTDQRVNAVAVQADGKIVIAGDFTKVNGVARHLVARLGPDGKLDADFDASPVMSESVEVVSLAVQPDGKILVGGFRLIANGGLQGLTRLNPDGTIDTSFHLSDDQGVMTMALQDDGRIVIGGVFSSVDGASRNCLARILPDGRLDTSFDPGTGANLGPNGSGSGIVSLALQPDGKVLIGGSFTVYNGVARPILARINSDGTLDGTFDPGDISFGVNSTASGGLNSVALQSGGRVIIGGGFRLVGGTPRNFVAGLTGDLFATWAAGDAADKTVSIPIVDDLLDEPDETVTLTLTPLTSGVASGATPTATLKIIDNDVPPSFTSATPPHAITRIPYTHTFTANGTPSPTFSLTAGTLPPGLFLQSNGVLSGTTTTAGTFSNITVTASNGVAPVATQTFDLTVDSGGVVQFSSANFSVGENAGTATITVSRVGGSAGSTTVMYSAFGNTATSGSDFTLTPGTLTFADGETSKSFDVTIVNDDVNERDETVILSLSALSGSATLGTPTTATLTILNDDPLPTISVDDVTVTEGDAGTKQALFTITRTGLVDRAVIFTARTADDTALAQEDYLPLSGQFQIAPSVTSMTVAVGIFGDTITEPDKSFTLNLSSSLNATITRAQAVCTIKDNESSTGPPTIQFARRNFSASEGDGTAAVTVTRSGDTSAPATVAYSTTNPVGAGAASDRSDYTTAFGTLSFAAGETTKTFTVFITDDALVEGDEVFAVTLTSPTGGATLGVPSTSLVKITDNDAAPSASNPADDTSFYVRQHYRDFLGRDPDAAGLQFWTNEIEKCGSDTDCRAVKRVNVSAAFFLSIEFQNTGYLVYRLYKASFNTGERLPFRTFLSDAQEIGQGVVVGSDGWEQKLETNKQAFLDEFVARPAFTTQYPQSLTPAQFVDALNAFTGDPLNPTAGGSLTQAERDQLVADLASGAKSRAQVLRAVAENAEFQSRQTNKAFVYMQYVGYLRRGPSDAPDSDFTGYNFWLGKLNQFNGNFVQAEMVKAFISSIEYRQRFGTP